MSSEIKLGKEKKERIYFIIVFIVILYLIIIARLFYLQILNEDYYKQLSENNSRKVKLTKAPRGKIYDCKGRLIATNVAGYRVVFLKNDKFATPEIISKIAEVTEMTTEYIQKAMRTGEVYKYTKERVLIDDYDEKKAHILMEKLSDYPYLDVLAYPKRKYLMGNIASHIIGYVRPISDREYEELKDKGYSKSDVIGKKGIEKQYNEELRGIDGYEYIEVNAYGKLVKNIETKPAIPGQDIYLSIDIELQSYMTDAMKGLKGTAIIMDVKNGKIKTMVSVPEYDIVKFSSKLSSKDWNAMLNDPAKPMINRATVAEYPPGSIFKPIGILSLLEMGVKPLETVYDPGYFKLGRNTWKCWETRGHGSVNMERALVVSCNTYFYTMMNRYGNKKLTQTAARFGIGEITGIDIPEEKKGILPNEEWKRKRFNQGWYGGDTLNFSIGQGYLLTTPLQMLNVYAILGNKGVGYKPKLVDKLIGSQNIVREIPDEKSIDLNTKQEYLDFIENAMRKTVTNGTAGRLNNIPGTEVGAKTGSAENPHSKLTHAWIAGVSPYKNPEIAFIVFIEGLGHGGTIAGPVARQLLEKYYEIKEGEKNAAEGNQ
jgi:penicillin-binding protein 2